MEDFVARFSSPVPATRPRGARLLEGYSPKFNRRVQFFDHLAFSPSGPWLTQQQSAV